MNVAVDSDVKFLTKLLKFAPNSFLFSSAHGLKLQSPITKAHSYKYKMPDSILRGIWLKVGKIMWRWFACVKRVIGFRFLLGLGHSESDKWIILFYEIKKG